MNHETQTRDFDALGMGEVLLRLSPPHKDRILYSDSFEKRVGGAELNVMSGISLLGLRTGIVTKLPQNEIGKFAKNRIRFSGVSDDYIIWDDDKTARLGLYYYEYGAKPRKPVVVYDRFNSSFNSLKKNDLDDSIFKSTRLFHTCGITLGLNETIRKECIDIIKEMKKNKTIISFDVNFRRYLWDEPTARKEIEKILPLVDILFASEETSLKMFQKTGTNNEMMESYTKDFGIEIVASTQRIVHSADRHTWNSTIYSKKENHFFTEVPYTEIEVVDRIGSGDAYVAGALFGILKYQDMQKAVQFGNAMAAIKNTIPGDMPVSDFTEISRIITEHSEHNTSEMIR